MSNQGNNPEQIGTPAVYYRGGTSKAVFVDRRDLPATNDEDLVAWILAIYGSPDKRQIDGMGGADLLTSKFAVAGPSTREDADVDYTFYQVGITEPTVSTAINCGNISSAVGPYAIDQGLPSSACGPTRSRRSPWTMSTGDLARCSLVMDNPTARAPRRSRNTVSAAREGDAGGARRVSKGRDREMVADHQEVWDQGGMSPRRRPRVQAVPPLAGGLGFGSRSRAGPVAIDDAIIAECSS
jgi:hypothetical protein